MLQEFEGIISVTDEVEPYEVYAVRYGTRSTRRSDVYLNFHLYGEPDDRMGMDYFFWVVRNSTHLLLVDSGFGVEAGRRRERTTLCEVPDAVRRFGVEPAEIATLLVTHAHYDHIGNLDAFPAAEILISRREYGFWTGPMARRRQFASSAEEAEIDYLRTAHADGRVRFVGTDDQPAPGISVIEVGGHTPGQLVVIVPTADGRVVLASDALHYYEELDRDWPFLHASHLEAMYAGFDVLTGLVREPATTLVPGHDPAVMQRFPACDGDLAALAGLAVRIA